MAMTFQEQLEAKWGPGAVFIPNGRDGAYVYSPSQDIGIPVDANNPLQQDIPRSQQNNNLLTDLGPLPVLAAPFIGAGLGAMFGGGAGAAGAGLSAELAAGAPELAGTMGLGAAGGAAGGSLAALADPTVSTVGGVAGGDFGLGASSFGTGASVPTTTTFGSGIGATTVPTATLPGVASGTAGIAGAGLADPFGGFDNAAIEGADFSGAAEAGLSAGTLGGGGALGASSLAASGASAGGGGGSSAGGGGTAGAGAGGSIFGDLADDDWLRILARGAPGLLGALGSASQAEDFEDLAHQYQQMGAPYRGRLEQLYGDPTAFLNSPEVRQPIQQGTDMLARSLSVKGNPAGSGNALQELQNYASTQLFGKLGQEKDRLGGFGGLTQYNQAAPQMAANTINAQGNIYGSLGGAAADIFNPQRRYTLQDLLGY